MTCWLHPAVSVGPSPIQGVGLFARENLSAGTVISRLGGRRVSTDELRDLLAGASSYVDTIEVGPDLHLVLPPDTPNGKGNHSCDPNLWWSGPGVPGAGPGVLEAGPGVLEARRDIAAGEELTNDYATSTRSPLFVMACSCGSGLCRGTVTGDDWRLPTLRLRYGTHWSFAR